MSYKVTLGLAVVALIAWEIFTGVPWAIVSSWWAGLTQPQATLIGAIATLLAAFLGFAGGTIFNHHLTLRREDIKDSRKAKQVALALAAELTMLGLKLKSQRDLQRRLTKGITAPLGKVDVGLLASLYQLPPCLMFQEHKDSILLLPPTLAKRVFFTYSGIEQNRFIVEHTIRRIDLGNELDDKMFRHDLTAPILSVLEGSAAALYAFAGVDGPPKITWPDHEATPAASA